jgi:hypothetical protein
MPRNKVLFHVWIYCAAAEGRSFQVITCATLRGGCWIRTNYEPLIVCNWRQR